MRELDVNLRTLRSMAGFLTGRPRRLPPIHLRPWVAILTGARAQADLDELPEVVMPSRIGRHLPDAWWSDCTRIEASLAWRWELLSASHGCTIKEMVWRSTIGEPPRVAAG
jgi:hypothetical protein